MSAVAERVLELAVGFIGVREATGNNDGEPMRLFMNGESVPGSDGKIGYAWCAAFVTKVFQLAGCPLPGNQRKIWAVEEMFQQLAKKKAGRQIGDARGGDLAILPRGKALHGHVELVTGLAFNEETKLLELRTIGGNVADQVARRVHHFEMVRGEPVPHVAIMRWPV